MDFLNDPVLTLFGRPDFIGGIDNEALDFGQLESFIHVSNNHNNNSSPTITGNGTPINSITTPITTVSSNSSGSNTTTTTNAATSTAAISSHLGTAATVAAVAAAAAAVNATTLIVNQLAASRHLPESPPDSGSEPPYSPSDIHGLAALNPSSHHEVGTPYSSVPTTAALHLLNEIHHHEQHHPHHHNQHHLHQHHGIATLCPGDSLSLTTSENTLMAAAAAAAATTPNSTTSGPTSISEATVGAGQPIDVPVQQLHSMYMKSEVDGATVLSSVDTREQLHLQGPTLLGLASPLARHSVHAIGSYLGVDMTSPQLTMAAVQSISVDDIRGLSDAYGAATTTTTTTTANTTTTTATTTTTKNAAAIVNHRKRKLSQPDTNGTASSSIVKPEPVALSPMMTPSACTEPLSPNSCSGGMATQLSQMADTSSGDTSSSQQNSDSGDTCPLQCIRFSPFQQQNWHVLCDQSLQELPIPHYRVDADKGFNFSNSDDAFVCQKKNHFQITCHAQLQGTAIFVRTTSGLEKIKSFHLHFYGVKLEAPTQTIRVEQSQSDRSKKPFHPVLIDLQNRQVSKVTVGRLHFSETTSNNMRKKGRPNPEQRYFQLVVGLHAHTHSGHFPVISQGSERIIVRASNPGQFESDVELCWQRGVTQDSIYHAGRVGINTDRPDESLVVHGNLKVSGHIVQPSDSRAKQEIGELNTAQQLRNVQRIRVVKYRYEPEFAVHSGLAASTRACDEVVDTGVIAQEIREVLPDAVKEAGSIRLPNGQVIDNFLFVNKDRIYMENIGAVKELSKVTGSLETRIAQLERINQRLVRIQSAPPATVASDKNGRCCKQMDCDGGCGGYGEGALDEPEACSNKMIQIVIVVLVFIMAVCLAAISTLYFVEHHKQTDHYYHVAGDSGFVTHYGGGSGDSGSNPYERNFPSPKSRPDHSSSNRLTSTTTTTRSQSSLYAAAAATTATTNDNQELALLTVVASPSTRHTVSYAEETAKLNKKTKNAKTAAVPDAMVFSGGAGVGQAGPVPVDGIDAIVVSNVLSSAAGGENEPLQKPADIGNDAGDEHGYLLLNDVDSNLIDTGQTTKNDSQTEPLTIVQSSRNSDQQDIDLQNLLNTSDPDNQLNSSAGTETNARVRSIGMPIGMPQHCIGGDGGGGDGGGDSHASTIQPHQPSIQAIACKSTCCASKTGTCEANAGDAQRHLMVLRAASNDTLANPNDERPVEIKEIQTPMVAQRMRTERNACVHIDLMISTQSFNATLGADEVCFADDQSLVNITYNVPLSRFMIERHFQLIFTSTTNETKWALCSARNHPVRQASAVTASTTSASTDRLAVQVVGDPVVPVKPFALDTFNGTIDGKLTTSMPITTTSTTTTTTTTTASTVSSTTTTTAPPMSQAIFGIDVPPMGQFKRQLDFRTRIGGSKGCSSEQDVCKLTLSSDSGSLVRIGVASDDDNSTKNAVVQLIVYTINIFRDCD